MTFRQWWAHIRQWLFAVSQFPLPRGDTHIWTGIVGEREQICLVCGAEGVDREMTDEEIERDREMTKDYEAIHEKYFGKDEDV